MSWGGEGGREKGFEGDRSSKVSAGSGRQSRGC